MAMMFVFIDFFLFTETQAEEESEISPEAGNSQIFDISDSDDAFETRSLKRRCTLIQVFDIQSALVINFEVYTYL